MQIRVEYIGPYRANNSGVLCTAQAFSEAVEPPGIDPCADLAPEARRGRVAECRVRS